MVKRILAADPAGVKAPNHRGLAESPQRRRLRLANAQDPRSHPTVVVVSASYRLGTVHGAAYEALSRLASRDKIAAIVPMLTLPHLPHFDHLTRRAAAHPALDPVGEAFHRADAVLFCIAEYAEGLPSVVVNLLEWAIADGSLCQKPTGWINLASGSSGGRAAHAALERALSYAGADLVVGVNVPVCPADLSEDGRLRHAAAADRLLEALRRLLTSRHHLGTDPATH